jgi:ketosteroid isomerase-like protein
MSHPRRAPLAGLVPIALVTLVALACAPAPPADNSAEARAGIEAANATFMKLVAEKNAAGLAALYTEDARVLPPNSPPVEGRAAIEQLFAGLVQGIAKLQLDTVEVEGHGDTAHEVEALTFYDAAGNKIDEGKAIVIWKKVGEEWKLHRDIFSSNLPPPPPAVPANEAVMPPANAATPAAGADGASTAAP